MIRAACLALLLALAGLPAVAEEDAPAVAWFESIPSARDVAARLGRPIFLAVHPRRAGVHSAWPVDPAAWSEVYADARVVEASRQFACALHVVAAPPAPGDPESDGRPQVRAAVSKPFHLVLDPTGKTVLARVDEWRAEPGEPSVKALLALFAAALERAGPVSSETPLVTPERVPAHDAPAPGSDPLNPAPVPLEGPGFRTRLRWQLPMPGVEGDAAALVPAAVSMYWDGVGPFALGEIEIRAGTDVDVPVDVRFADHEGLAEHLTRGKHRVDVYLAPVEGGFAFSRGPLHVGLVWIDLGDDDGGGSGAGQDDQQTPQDQETPPPEPEASPPQPEEGQEPPPMQAELDENEHVVEPFMREGEEIEKDDAIVAVEDEDAGVKPPPEVPSEASPRTYEKVLENSVAWERIPLQERAFLRRYFEALRAAAKKAEEGKPK